MLPPLSTVVAAVAVPDQFLITKLNTPPVEAFAELVIAVADRTIFSCSSRGLKSDGMSADDVGFDELENVLLVHANVTNPFDLNPLIVPAEKSLSSEALNSSKSTRP